jgi:hypothetical protein
MLEAPEIASLWDIRRQRYSEVWENPLEKGASPSLQYALPP